jgi:hypothetical protein
VSGLSATGEECAAPAAARAAATSAARMEEFGSLGATASRGCSPTKSAGAGAATSCRWAARRRPVEEVGDFPSH